MTITNKFAGKCNTCSARVGAGEGIARKQGGKWLVFCSKDAGETHGSRNPWKGLHQAIAGDYAETRREARIERKLVDSEYSNTDRMAEPCPTCGGTCHYRATVGAIQCPNCRTMIVYTIDQETHKTKRSVIVR